MKKTTISFGLVSIPVSINPIIKNNDISFNQLHKKCLSRIKYVKYCPHCKKEVKQVDIIKGYQYKKDDYITITDEEFNNLKSEDEKVIDIVGFIDLKEIDPIYLEKSYIVGVASKSKAFSLFKAALKETKRVALAKTIISTKFYYVILRLTSDGLIMNTLYFPEEIVIPEALGEAKYTKKELDLAVKLINSLKMKFNPDKMIDEYQERVKLAIEDKLDGKKIKKARVQKESNIKDLMKALELSLKNV